MSPVYVAIRLLTSVRDADADLVLAHLGGLSARLGKSIADSIGQQINAESDATEKVRFQRGGESALGQARRSRSVRRTAGVAPIADPPEGMSTTSTTRFTWCRGRDKLAAMRQEG